MSTKLIRTITGKWQFFLAGLWALQFHCHTPVADMNWPGGAKAAICLSYDDGMSSQLQTAVPQLNEFGFKGTFFLNEIHDHTQADRWRQVAEQGHELGNHTLFHPCSKSLKLQNGYYLEDYTLDQMMSEIGAMNEQLDRIEGKSQLRTFAYPCAQSEVAGQSYIRPLQNSGLVHSARGGVNRRPVITDFSTLDPFQVPAWSVSENSSGRKLIGFAKKARQQRGLAIYMFHGVGDQWIKVSSEAHLELLQFLQVNKKDFWVASFKEVMEFVKEEKS